MSRFDLPRPFTERAIVHASLVSYMKLSYFRDHGSERVSLARAHCEFSGLYAGGTWKCGSGKWSVAWPPNLDPL